MTNWDCLSVTSVNVVLPKDTDNRNHVLAYASVVLNDQLMLRGLKVMDGDNGLYVGFPVGYGGDEYRSWFFPLTRALREHIQTCVLEKYHYYGENGCDWVVKYGTHDEVKGELRVRATGLAEAVHAAERVLGDALVDEPNEILSAEIAKPEE